MCKYQIFLGGQLLGLGVCVVPFVGTLLVQPMAYGSPKYVSNLLKILQNDTSPLLLKIMTLCSLT
jgi:hypothetical protein